MQDAPQDAPKDAIASARQMGEIYKTAIDRFIDGLDENFTIKIIYQTLQALDILH